MRKLWTWLMRPAFGARGQRRLGKGGQRGVALLIVTAGLTVLGALNYTYRQRSFNDSQSAENTRDELRAHYLARSGVNLSRLVIKVQQSVVDKFRRQIGDVQLADFVPTLIRAFSGSKDEIEGLASLVGNVDTSKITGLGLTGDTKHQTFDLNMDTDDGRINLNCAGGSPQSAQALEGKLAGLVMSPQYDHYFLKEDPEGQLTDRITLVHAIIDYIDRDEAMFGAGGAAENYGYDSLKEVYLAKNNYIDSVEELQLVRGIGDELMDEFRSSFTVYGGCKVNMAALTDQSAPVFAMLIFQAAKSPEDRVLHDPVRLLKLVNAVTQVRSLFGVPFTVDSFMSTVKDPASALANPTGQGGMLQGLLGGGGGAGGPAGPGGGGTTGTAATQQIDGVDLDPQKLNALVVDQPRRTYRVSATATVGRVSKRIFGIFDSQHVNQNTTDPAYRQGTWVYWRED